MRTRKRRGSRGGDKGKKRMKRRRLQIKRGKGRDERVGSIDAAGK